MYAKLSKVAKIFNNGSVHGELIILPENPHAEMNSSPDGGKANPIKWIEFSGGTGPVVQYNHHIINNV